MPPAGAITVVVAQSPLYYPHVERHLQSLKRVFAEVTLLYWEKDAAEPLYASPGVACERLVLPFEGGSRYFLGMMAGFYARLVKLRPNNIEAIDPLALVPARAFAIRNRFFGSPVGAFPGTSVRIAYFSMEYFSELPALKNKPLKRFAWRVLERWGAAGAASAATVCDSIAARLSEDLNMRVITVRNMPWNVRLDVPAGGDGPGLHARCGLPRTLPIALYQGMLQVGRGLETAIRGLASVPDLHFAVIGWGQLRETLVELAKTEGCADRVHFLGEVGFQALVSLTRDAFVGLVPIQAISKSYQYSLPGKLFEYIQAGVPVIATSLPEIRKVVDGFGVGICLEEYTPETLASALRRLRDDTSFYASLRANVARAKPELCWEAEEGRYLSLYGTGSDPA